MGIIDNDLFTQTNPNPNSPRNNPSLAGQLTNLNNEVNSIEDTLVQGYVRESASVSYVSSSSFTVSGDVTAIYTNGRIVRFSDGTTGIVSSSSYSSTTAKTTVTMLTGTVPSSLSYVDIAVQPRGQTSGLASRVLGDNNVVVVSQKDNNETERSVLKVNSSNILEIGDSNLAGQQFNTPLVNNTAIKQKDNTGTERSVLKINSSNVLEIGDSNLAGWTINGGGTTLGYAQVSSSQGGITTLTDLTGLSVSVNVPAGGRRIKITGWLPQVYSSVAGDRADFHIREGNTSLAVAYTRTNLVSDGGFGGLTVMAVLIPSAGNHTYKLSLARGLGTGSLTFYAGSETKAFILVELI